LTTPAHRAESSGRRKVRDTASGAVADWAIHERANLAPGAGFSGPAIIVEAETSTIVGAGWRGRVTAEYYIELTREMAR
jgi:N-methylhydantoinase A